MFGDTDRSSPYQVCLFGTPGLRWAVEADTPAVVISDRRDQGPSRGIGETVFGRKQDITV